MSAMLRYCGRLLAPNWRLLAPGRRSSTECRQAVKVTLIGTCNTTNQTAALLLKQNSLISELSLVSNENTAGIAMDLRHVTTNCAVNNFQGLKELGSAVKDADIIVIGVGHLWTVDMPERDIFMLNKGFVRAAANACAVMRPEAIVAVVTCPINMMVPVVCEMYKSRGVYNPDKIIGMCTLSVVRANALVGHSIFLDPACVHVPIIGGVSAESTVPLLSRAQPFAEFPQETVERLTTQIRSAGRDVIALKGQGATMSRAFAMNRFVLTLARGLLRMPDTVMTAYVRSSALPHCKYFATQLLFGAHGVERNFGIPKLTAYELRLVERAASVIVRDVQDAQRYAAQERKRLESQATC